VAVRTDLISRSISFLAIRPTPVSLSASPPSSFSGTVTTCRLNV